MPDLGIGRIQIERFPHKLPQRRFSARALSEYIECAVRSIGLHLINHLQKLPEPPFWKTSLVCEPHQILRRQIVDPDAIRRKMRRTKLPERHVSASDLGEVGCHSCCQVVRHEQGIQPARISASISSASIGMPAMRSVFFFAPMRMLFSSRTPSFSSRM
jgi:hypothetical protein